MLAAHLWQLSIKADAYLTLDLRRQSESRSALEMRCHCAFQQTQTRGWRCNVRSGTSSPTVRSCGKVWATSSFPQSFLNSSHLCVRGASADWPRPKSNCDVTTLCCNDVTGMALNASHVTFSTLKWIRDFSGLCSSGNLSWFCFRFYSGHQVQICL